MEGDVFGQKITPQRIIVILIQRGFPLYTRDDSSLSLSFQQHQKEWIDFLK